MPFLEETAEGVYKLTVRTYPLDGSGFETRLTTLEAAVDALPSPLPDPASGDEGQVWTPDGWADPLAHVFLFDPGLTPGGNAYNDWDALEAALGVLDVHAPKVVQFTTSDELAFPARPFDLNGATLRGVWPLPSFWKTITFPTGAKILNPGFVLAEVGLFLASESDDPVIDIDGDFFTLLMWECTVVSRAAPFFDAVTDDPARVVVLGMQGGSGLMKPSDFLDMGGDSIVANHEGDGYLLVEELGGGANTTKDSTLGGGGLILHIVASPNDRPGNLNGHEGDSQPAASNYQTMLLSNAEKIAMYQANHAHWGSVVSGSSVKAHLDYLAAEVASFVAGSGDVVGPGSSVDGRIALFDGTDGKLLKQSAAAPGDAAFKNTGTGSGDVAAGDHTHTGPVIGGQDEGSSITNTTTPTSLLDSTINVTATAGQVVQVRGCVAYVNNSGTTRSPTLALKLGSTTVFTLTHNTIQASASTRALEFDLMIRVEANNDVNASGQSVSLNASGAGVVVSARGTAAEAIQSGVALDLIWTHPTSDATQTAALDYVTVMRWGGAIS